MLLAPQIKTFLLFCINNILQDYSNNITNVLIKGDYKLNYPTIIMNNVVEGFRIKIVSVLSNQEGTVAVLNLDEMKSIYSFMMDLRYIPYNNIKYIFIGKRVPNLFETLLNINIRDVVFIETSTGNIFTYFPYNENEKANVDPVLIGNCQNEIEFQKLYQNKYPKNWKGKKFDLCYSTSCSECVQSIEFQVFRLISNYFNIDLNEKQTDGFCGFFFSYGRSGLLQPFDVTIPFSYDTPVWLVPISESLHIKFYPIKVFKTEVWILLIFSIILLSILWWVRYVFFHKTWNFLQIFQGAIFISSLLLEQSPKYSKKTFSKVLLILMSFYLTFMMNAIYRTRFFNLLTGEIHIDEINTEQDIFRKMKICYPKTRVSSHSRDLGNHVFYNNSAECLRDAAFNKKFATYVWESEEEQIRHTLVDEKGKYLLRKIGPTLPMIRIFGTFSKGHVFFPIFNKYLWYSIEHGLIDYIERKIVSKYEEPSMVNEKLNIQHIEAPLCMLIIGSISGFLVFVYEIYYKKYN